MSAKDRKGAVNHRVRYNRLLSVWIAVSVRAAHREIRKPGKFQRRRPAAGDRSSRSPVPF